MCHYNADMFIHIHILCNIYIYIYKELAKFMFAAVYTNKWNVNNKHINTICKFKVTKEMEESIFYK